MAEFAESSGAIGRYQLLNTLGRGGFATVFRALDTGLDREVALKVLGSHLAEDDRYRSRFLTEARLMARLHHPNIVTVYDVGESGERPFFAMELIEGDTLEKLLAYGEQLSPEHTLDVMRDLAGAVDYLHAAGVIHRDVKAANVMIEPSGRAVLMDFGIARMLDDVQLTQSGAVMGTPETMAPEQARGETVGAEADIYALGVLAYRMLAGRPPFVGNTAVVLHAHAFDDPVSLRVLRPGLPANMYAAVTSALAKDPVHRPRTAASLVNSMERALDLAATEPAGPRATGTLAPVPAAPALFGSPAFPPPATADPAIGSYDETVLMPVHTLVEPPPAAPAPATPPRRRGRLPLLVGLVLVLLAVAGVAAFALSRGGGNGPSGTPVVAGVSPTPSRAELAGATTSTPAATRPPATNSGGASTGAAAASPVAASTTSSATGSGSPTTRATAALPVTSATAGGALGDLDLNRYCQGMNATLRLRADNSWACHNSDDSVTTVDLNAACAKQYGRADAVAQQKPESDPPAFRCLTP